MTIQTRNQPWRTGSRTGARLAVVLAGLMLLAGCGGVRQAIGIGVKNPPDEFQVVRRAPLVLPPDYSLRPPVPGASRPQEGTAQQQAARALTGSDGTTASEPLQSGGTEAILARAGVASADPDIRRTVDQETVELIENSGRFFDALIFWQPPADPAVTLDAEAEAVRLRRNQALGLPLSEGELPTITRKRKAVFEGIF
ncbi:MAG: DUF3035 domain-containing protein [Alphaproteobacteria bacterium]